MSNIPRVKFNSVYKGNTGKEVVDQIKKLIEFGVEFEYDSKNLKSRMIDSSKKLFCLYLNNRIVIFYKNTTSISVLSYYDNTNKQLKRGKAKKNIYVDDKVKKYSNDELKYLKLAIKNGVWTPNTLGYTKGKFESKYLIDNIYVVAEEMKDKIKIKYYNKINLDK